MDKEKTFGYKVGTFMANVVVGCIAACITACAIALTVRFITLLF